MPTFPDDTPLVSVRNLLNATGLRRNDFDATDPPNAGYDQRFGWEVGSRIIAAGVEYICKDATQNAAVWLLANDASAAIVAQQAKDGVDAVAPNVRKINTDAGRAPLPSDDETQGYEVGSRWLWQGQEWVRSGGQWQETTSYDVETLAALIASQRSYPHGSVITTRAEGYSYEVVSSGEDMITAGGVHLRVNSTDGAYPIGAFGAAGDGTTNDTAAFQAAIDAVPDGTPIRLSNRNYVVAIGSLVTGSKNVRWIGEGTINGGVALSLPGLVEVKHPTAQQQLHSLDQKVTDGSPHLRVRRAASYTGNSTGSGSGFKAETVSGAGAGLYEFNAIFEHLTDSTADASQHCGSYNRIVKGSGATANIWGFALAALNKSEVDAQTVGAEINIRVQDDHTVAGPLFNTGRRVILDLVGSTVDDLAATRKGRIDTGLQITCNTGAKATNITYGIHLDSIGSGGGTIGTAIRVDTAGVGVAVQGGTGALIHGGVSPGGTAAVNLTGSGLSYGLSVTGGYGAAIRVGNDLRMQFGNTAEHSIRYNSTGDALQFMHQSSAQIAVQIDDDDTNPVQFRVNGTVRRVSVGAPDSAGSGYRQLRVVN